MKRFIPSIVAGIVLTCTAGVATLAVGLRIISRDLPSIDSLKNYQPKLTSRVFDVNGHLIGRFATQRRTLIALDKVPRHVKEAFLAAEDADFYHHSGLDYIGLIRAVINELRYLTTGGKRQGASTITQQVTRTMLLSREQTYTRKIKEMLLTRRIEKALTKDQILHLYLNQIYFGHGAYGIEEAARTYYGAGTTEITLGQAAALAAIPKSPNRLNPLADSDRLRARRAYVLERMVEQKFISPQQADQARQESVRVHVPKPQYLDSCPYYVESIRRLLVEQLGTQATYEGGLSIHAAVDAPTQHAARAALRHGLHNLDKRQGWRGPLRRMSPQERQAAQETLRQARVTLFQENESAEHMWDLQEFATAFDFRQPRAALPSIRGRLARVGELTAGWVKSVSDIQGAEIDLGSTTARLSPQDMRWARDNDKTTKSRGTTPPSQLLRAGDIVLVRVSRMKSTWTVTLEQTPVVQGAVVAVDPHTHHVRAMVGGYDFHTSQFNRAQQAWRQMGSAVKPFLYALTIDRKLVTPASLITDAPQVFFESRNQWKPRNHTLRFLGDITVRRCLTSSINTCSIQLLQKLGAEPLLELARAVNLPSPQSPFPDDLTLALGSGETTPLRFTNAFSIFANGGLYAEPVLVTRITDAQGEEIWHPCLEKKRVLGAQAAFIVTDILRGTFRWGISKTLIKGLQHQAFAGKTGTTNDYRSAWFMGIAPGLVSGVYVGSDDNSSLGQGEYGVRAALPIWGDFARQAFKDVPPREFVEPPGIVWRRIHRGSGKLASLQDLLGDMENDTLLEAFIEGTQPQPQEREQQELPPIELLDPL